MAGDGDRFWLSLDDGASNGIEERLSPYRIDSGVSKVMIAGLKSYPFSAYSIHPYDGPAKRLHFGNGNLMKLLDQEGEPGNLKYQPEGAGKGIGGFFRKNLLAANRIYCFWLPMISDAVFKHRGGKSKSQNQALAAKLVYQPTPATSLKDLRDVGLRKQFQMVSFQAKDGTVLPFGPCSLCEP